MSMRRSWGHGTHRPRLHAVVPCCERESRSLTALCAQPVHTQPLPDASHAMTAGHSAFAPPPSALASLGLPLPASQQLLATQAGSVVSGKQPSASTGHMLPTPQDGQVPGPALEALLQTLGNPMAQLGGAPALPMAHSDHPLAHAASAPLSAPASRGRPGRTGSDARPASSYNARHQQARGREGLVGAAVPPAARNVQVLAPRQLGTWVTLGGTRDRAASFPMPNGHGMTLTRMCSIICAAGGGTAKIAHQRAVRLALGSACPVLLCLG